MGRPYMIHDARPFLIPSHPFSLPFDLGEYSRYILRSLSSAGLTVLRLQGLIAHCELQSIVGQVMDTFRDRIYGLPGASDEMPSPVVTKVSAPPQGSPVVA